MLRAAKIVLVFGVAVFYTFVVFNNLTDYDSESSIRAPHADDGHYVSGESRDVAGD